MIEKNIYWKRFLFFGIGFLLINVSFYFLKYYGLKYSFVAGLVDKHQRISLINEPKLVLVGGSNLAFGVDSEYLETNLDYKVYNMGHDIALGCIYPLEEVAQYIKPGDVIVLIPEYNCISEVPDLYGGSDLSDLIVISPKILSYLTEVGQIKVVLQKYFMNDQWVLLEISGLISQIIYPPSENDVYYRGAINEYGDVINHLYLPSHPKGKKTFALNCNNTNCYKMIDIYNEFYKKMRKRDVSVYFSFPPYNAAILDNTYQVAEEYYSYIVANLDIPTFGTPVEYFYDSSYFFDSAYHLTKEGRQIRTESLANYLLEILGK